MNKEFSNILVYVYKNPYREAKMTSYIGEYSIDSSLERVSLTLREKFNNNIDVTKISEIERTENLRLLNSTYIWKITIPCLCHLWKINNIEHGLIIYVGKCQTKYIDNFVDMVGEKLSELDEYLDIKNRYSWEK